MRVITGTAKGTILKAPEGMAIRPTTDRVKESVFAILGERIVNAKVLDLFSGTGNLGIESLSRGAQQVVFVDQSAVSLRLIKENLQRTRMTEKEHLVLRLNISGGMERVMSFGGFDLIFCDPPYNKGLIDNVLGFIDKNISILEGEGLIIVEHSKHEQVGAYRHLETKRLETYGETCISFIAGKN
ncbi:16S rRNA (guanine(966)-N(2))-methyltransferase RsmD [Acetonema longum]|uniref:Methyltransferase n=1 Tax=Acetonema longum DSM 6540 TaxID=1009370 RepID=F7NFL5_9FIRM|nr:16S rRNA (guanine(966)-N(2))-methyltransferase RsmD [Acetonema longum]EGO65138.1 methyltransferase [Acetonema longum DSM 6540]